MYELKNVFLSLDISTGRLSFSHIGDKDTLAAQVILVRDVIFTNK